MAKVNLVRAGKGGVWERGPQEIFLGPRPLLWLRPRLHGAGQVFIGTSFCANKLRLHGTGQRFVRFAFPFTRCLI